MEVTKGEEAKDGVVNIITKDSGKISSSEAKRIRIRKQEDISNTRNSYANQRQCC